jgi:hypothetical protein
MQVFCYIMCTLSVWFENMFFDFIFLFSLLFLKKGPGVFNLFPILKICTRNGDDVFGTNFLNQKRSENREQVLQLSETRK